MIKHVIKDTIDGLEFLHNNGVLHRDIKPQNILLAQDNRALICDFGVSKLLESPDASDMVRQTEGTFHFMAPEACDAEVEEFSGKAADVWALGITMYCMMFKCVPFLGETEFNIMEAIRTKPLVYPDSVEFSEGALQFLRKLLEKDSKLRPTISVIK